jgi:hypothetical protein
MGVPLVLTSFKGHEAILTAPHLPCAFVAWFDYQRSGTIGQGPSDRGEKELPAESGRCSSAPGDPVDSDRRLVAGPKLKPSQLQSDPPRLSQRECRPPRRDKAEEGSRTLVYGEPRSVDGDPILGSLTKPRGSSPPSFEVKGLEIGRTLKEIVGG